MATAPALLTADERIALVQVKVERAKKHIRELDAQVREYLRGNPYEIISKEDARSGQLKFYLSKVVPVPNEIAIITGDVVGSLRSALDHLVQQLYFVATGVNVVHTGLYFPIDSSAAQYKANSFRKIKPLRQDAIDAINSIEPYAGGKGNDFCILNRLCQCDKHRLLIEHVSVRYSDYSVGGMFRELLERLPPEWNDAEQREANAAIMAKVDESYFLTSTPTRGELKAGDEIPVEPINLKLGKNLKFRFTVALNEPGVVEGKPAIETVKHLADLVGNTITLFRPCLS